ncbi:hypothetical protein RRG08_005627 [Elysia crispata]|uniref:Uncharacterized protein n=1 Tax=Elysia crispata TaxID=231223 RepID=A0AAE1D6E1_9GAST|nr:hypothetical protein RRG08_005627 [Elysia crispata]
MCRHQCREYAQQFSPRVKTVRTVQLAVLQTVLKHGVQPVPRVKTVRTVQLAVLQTVLKHGAQPVSWAQPLFHNIMLFCRKWNA